MHRSKRKLLWNSAGSILYLSMPGRAEESLRREFPDLETVIARDKETVAQGLVGCEILATWNLSPEQFAVCRELRWVHSPAAGLDQICLDRLAERGVVLTNSGPVHAIPVAEHALALLLAMARRLPFSVRNQGKGNWAQQEGWEPPQRASEINGATLGLIGLGCIGREVAVRARALGMRVVAVKRDPSRGQEHADAVYAPGDLHKLLGEADYVLLAAPELPETRHLIGEPELRAMKSSAVLLNVSRGSLVDTEALVRALETGAIAGAALDVTAPEPLPAEHGLWKLENVLITPHLASATDRIWQRQMGLFTENLRCYLAGKAMPHRVDLQKGY